MTRRARFAAPPATGLEGNHHQTAFVGQELAVLRLFVFPTVREDCSSLGMRWDMRGGSQSA